MSGFSPEWLALRETADRAARSAGAVASLPRRTDVLDIVDLGAGTGANLRYLAPRLGGRQRWRLVDDDDAVLDRAAQALRTWAACEGLTLVDGPSGGVRIEAGDLDAGGFECDVELVRENLVTELDRVVPESTSLVTASALLDLVSADWLDALAARCAAIDAAILFALTYDGRMHSEPAEPDDARVRALVNRHQRSDKGFGPALGPLASGRAIAAFAARGYALRVESTDWRIGPEVRELQAALLDGWLAAAVEFEPGEREALEAWRRRRMEHVEAGQSRLVVGHTDIAGVREGAGSGAA